MHHSFSELHWTEVTRLNTHTYTRKKFMNELINLMLTSWLPCWKPVYILTALLWLRIRDLFGLLDLSSFYHSPTLVPLMILKISIQWTKNTAEINKTKKSLRKQRNVMCGLLRHQSSQWKSKRSSVFTPIKSSYRNYIYMCSGAYNLYTLNMNFLCAFQSIRSFNINACVLNWIMCEFSWISSIKNSDFDLVYKNKRFNYDFDGQSHSHCFFCVGRSLRVSFLLFQPCKQNSVVCVSVCVVHSTQRKWF